MQTALSLEQACCGCHLTPICRANLKTEAHEQLKALPVKRRLVLQKNEILFSPNKPFQSLYAVEHGAIKTVQFEADGSELIRGFYFSGEILGYKAIYSGRYQSTASALCETRICVIDYKDFVTFLQSKPGHLEHLLNLISLQMNVGSYLVSTSADRKLAAFLLDLSVRLGCAPSQPEFQLPMPRQDIANYLRLTPETVSRICTRLQQQELIATEHKHVRLLRADLLRQIAEGQARI